MIGRIIWWASLAIIAFLTAGVQLDRQARKTPEIASQVPAIFRSAAQPRVTAAAIEADAVNAGIAEAKALVRSRPMPARHLRLLAQAQFAAGETEASGLAIQYAARRGWRDPLAQEAMMRLALAAGDRAEAVRRFSALFLMQGADRDLLTEAASNVFPQEAGEERAVFAEIVSGGERWHNAFLTRGARIIPVDAFVDTLEASITNGTRFPCKALTQARGVIEGRDAAQGQRLAQLVEGQC